MEISFIIISKDEYLNNQFKRVLKSLFPKISCAIHKKLDENVDRCERNHYHIYISSLDSFALGLNGTKCVFDDVILTYENEQEKDSFVKKITSYKNHFHFFKKPFDVMFLYQKINNILKRLNLVKEYGNFRLDKQYKEIANVHDFEIVSLTDKEIDIIDFLMENKCSAKSKQDLLKNVWGFGENVNTHTLETYIYRLRKKLEKDSANPKILTTVNDNEYKLNLS